MHPYSSACVDLGRNGRVIGVFGPWLYYYTVHERHSSSNTRPIRPRYTCRVYRMSLVERSGGCDTLLDKLQATEQQLLHPDFEDASSLAQGGVLSPCGSLLYAIRPLRTEPFADAHILVVRLEPHFALVSTHRLRGRVQKGH